MATNDTAKWQMAFWIITGFSVLLFTSSKADYSKLDQKIAYAEEKVRAEKNIDIDNFEKKIERVNSKIDQIQLEQKMQREQSQAQYVQIMVAIEKIKKE